MWGRMASCGRLAIGLPLPPENLQARTAVVCGLPPRGAGWHPAAGLAIRLPVICTPAASQGPIANRPQDAILPHIRQVAPLLGRVRRLTSTDVAPRHPDIIVGY